MNNSRSHDADGAIKKGVVLSGHTYVPVQLRDRNISAEKVLFRPPDKCNHEATICRECAESWGWDHVVHFDRTVAGRRLRAEIDAHTTPDTAPHHRPDPADTPTATSTPPTPDTPAT
ncbi:hypothetical protein [Nocardia vaccinii]|uniref:hypothetical protein n=1 Tax=Nocardia vaccinii TaxID=1822 RepID=UPI00082EE9E9|nr:hypothetical protein [Nocardia vaccinii]